LRLAQKRSGIYIATINSTSKGAAAQYGAAAQIAGGKTQYDSTQVVPAASPSPTTGANRANIKIAGQPGTYVTGKPDSTSGTVLISGVIQNKTDAMVVGQLSVPAKGLQGTAPDADNFLASTLTAGAGTGYGTVAANAAQAASAGKSLAPEHE
jgi:hypothetical protein